MMLLLLTSCATGKVVQKTDSPSDPIGQIMEVQDLEGNSATLSEAFENQPMLVVFFATYCVPFIHMIPALNSIQGIYAPRGFSVVGISLDLQPNIMLPPFVEEFKVDFPVLVGDDRLKNENMTPHGRIAEIPTYWLLDPQGNLVFQAAGVVSSADLDKRIRNLLLDNRSTD